MREYREIFGVLGLFVIVVPVTILLTLLGGGWLFNAVISIHPISTEDAPGFSERSFAKVKVGMKSEEVTGLLGKPLKITRGTGDSWEWAYTKSKEPFGEFGTWNLRCLILSNNLVAEVQSYREPND